MNTPKPPRLHPLLMIAALSVTLFSLAGVGVLTGIIPHAQSTTAQGSEAAASPTASTTPPPPTQATGAPLPTTPPAPATAAAAPAGAPVVAAPAPTPVHHAARKAVKVASKDPTPMPPSGAGVPPDYVPPPPQAAAPPAPPVCSECGAVETVREVVKEGEASGAGAVAGGLVGGIVGNQIGSGGGRSVARILGMVGGAVAGHEIEKNARKTTQYNVTVRMEDGSARTIVYKTQPAWRIGERVKVVNGELVPAS